MQKQSIRGVIDNQRGAFLIIMVFMVLVLMLLFAGMVDIGRLMIAREQTQTAADSAALAASGSGVTRWVEIEVHKDRGTKYACCGRTKSGGCISCCKDCDHDVVRLNIKDTEKFLIDEEGWKNFVPFPCNCSEGPAWYKVNRRWVTYDITSSNNEQGMDSATIANMEATNTSDIRETISLYADTSSGIVTDMLAGKSLTEISYLIENESAWRNSWFSYGSRYYGEYIYSEGTDEYNQCYYDCSQVFNDVTKMEGWVDRAISQINKLETLSQNPTTNQEMTANDAAEDFFAANKPQDAQSKLFKTTVYSNADSDYYPSVVVYAGTKVSSLLSGVMNALPGIDFPETWKTLVSAQGNTYYKAPPVIDYDTQTNQYETDNSQWRKAPLDATWVDWTAINKQTWVNW